MASARLHRASGQAIYRWKLNQVLARSSLGVQLADTGDDAGRIVRSQPDGLGELVDALVELDASGDPHVPPAIELFRRRGATREDRKAAAVELAGVFEEHRALLTERLSRADISPLFNIANNFALRHRTAEQFDAYPDEALDWICYWYLATIDLLRQLR